MQMLHPHCGSIQQYMEKFRDPVNELAAAIQGVQWQDSGYPRLKRKCAFCTPNIAAAIVMV